MNCGREPHTPGRRAFPQRCLHLFPTITMLVLTLPWSARAQTAAASVPAAIPQTAALLRRVDVSGTDELIVITLTADSPVTGRLREVPGPQPRRYVDLHGVRPQVRGVTPVNRGPLLRVRVALNTADPPVTRVVLDLSIAAPARIERGASERELRILVGEGKAATSAVSEKFAVGAAEASRVEATRAEGSQSESPRFEPQRVEAARAEAARVERPRGEAPPSEAQRVEAPRAEVARVERPRGEAPRTEAPRVKAPGTELQPPSQAQAPAAPAPSADADIRWCRDLADRLAGMLETQVPITSQPAMAAATAAWEHFEREFDSRKVAQAAQSIHFTLLQAARLGRIATSYRNARQFDQANAALAGARLLLNTARTQLEVFTKP